MDIKGIASRALDQLDSTGFDESLVAISVSDQDELSILMNEPNLLRSTEDYSLTLTGIVDNRKASMMLTDLNEGVIDNGINELLERARLSPQDEAHAVSSKQVKHFEQGPLQADMDLLAKKTDELLAYRSRETPKMNIEHGDATHRKTREVLLTSKGTELSCEIGAYSLSVFGTATEGDQSSSFNYSGGTANDLSDADASEYFGLGQMMRETEQQIYTASFDGNFIGDIVLAPTAVSSLLGWLLGQVRDFALISDASVFRDRVGEKIASENITVTSQFNAPGHAAYTEDGFIADPLTLVEEGKLNCLLPSYYGSRKTGIAHVPASSGWSIRTGSTSRDDLIAGIDKGALVNRLSMGSPGPNGDFSGVIKNSFKIGDGRVGEALSETMIAGNMAEMLTSIVDISKEHLDLGGQDFPWIRIPGLNFS
jgi:PmbA protein